MRSVLAAGLLLALSACSGDGATGVSMRDHVFEPATLEVSAGETIVWTNESDESHTVTAFEDSFPAGAEYFSSGGASDEDAANDSLPNELIDPGESFELTLDEPGTYSYYCIPHMQDMMRGMIVVKG